MALSDITRDAVLQAIGECDRLGQDGFLARFGFDRARQYLLVHDGKRYDSKAIVGAAHGFLRGERALTAGEFSGGEATIGRLLRRLGFTVQVGDALTADGLVQLLSKLQVFRRDGLPALYQPITLLWAFGRVLEDEPRLVSWTETRQRPFRSLRPSLGRNSRLLPGSRIARSGPVGTRRSPRDGAVSAWQLGPRALVRRAPASWRSGRACV